MPITFIPAIIGTAILAPALATRRRISIRNATNTTLTLTSPVTAVLPANSEPLIIEGQDAASQIDGTLDGVPAGIGQEVAGTGSVVVDDSEEDSSLDYNPLHFHAYRASLKSGAVTYAMFRKGQGLGERFVLKNIVTRVDKGNRPDTIGSCSLVGVSAVNGGTAEVAFFSGDTWDDGVEQSITVTDKAEYWLEIENGAFKYISSTGEVTASSLPLSEMVMDPDGGEQSIEPGDVLIRFENKRVDNDQMSISANSYSWGVV